MKERKTYPPETNYLAPLLVVADVDRALEFYQMAFGFTKRHADSDERDRTVFASLKWQDSVLRIGRETAFGLPQKAPATSKVQCPVLQYVYVDDMDVFHERAVAAGAIEFEEPADMPHGDRMCILGDPE
jgi:uncharacterized glyoxalase superfamily protein PhnB